MAQSRTIDDAIDELMKDYRKAAKKAMEEASDKAVEDFYRFSMTCLEEYYENYEPNIYDRSDSLWHAFVPYLKIDAKDNSPKIKSTIGIEYSPSELEKYMGYSYNGSSKYQPVDAEWVIENYRKGRHPATNGARNSEYCDFFYNYDPVSPDQKMEGHLRKYATGKFVNDLLISFAKQIQDLM